MFKTMLQLHLEDAKYRGVFRAPSISKMKSLAIIVNNYTPPTIAATFSL